MNNARWPGAKSGPKYGNKKTELDGIKFDSIAESERYAQLKYRLKAGEISELKIQPRYNIVVNNVRVCAYVGDFEYQNKDGKIVVEDVKSPATKTPVYRLKKKLMLAVNGIEITEWMK